MPPRTLSGGGFLLGGSLTGSLTTWVGRIPCSSLLRGWGGGSFGGLKISGQSSGEKQVPHRQRTPVRNDNVGCLPRRVRNDNVGCLPRRVRNDNVVYRNGREHGLVEWGYLGGGGSGVCGGGWRRG